MSFLTLGKNTSTLFLKFCFKSFFLILAFKIIHFIYSVCVYKDTYIRTRVMLHGAHICERPWSGTKKARDGTAYLKAPWESGSPTSAIYC